MRIEHGIAGLREQLAAWRAAGERIALVPTMGNLHEGHLALVDEARRQAGRVVVSIFVNPLQFGEGEDFDGYPRTLETDCRQLEARGADLVFAPSVAEMYPDGARPLTRVTVAGISEGLCGGSRLGHFDGVATVVSKLFNIVQPDLAVFGKKDYQQLQVIRRMVRDLNMPLCIIGLDTVREPDGLAMSSRNGYLSPAERDRASALNRILAEAVARIRAGERDWMALESWGRQALNEAGFETDYFEVRRREDLARAQEDDRELIVLAAAWLGRARLIDNLEV
ncbi:pantoate--beta-alanine ligase [Alkalilimnicola sp. S0819]|uniref:pantoate--beta-alanine ligase n=1 Tax=Alkalilimnicola sp. S0819 TaxID=2613922 RepID=UPI0012624A8D|nr:pantoate--beta-alanine ligase [Alkalilimnicola sp. S0819]KAB7628344.1 pantoate--beta-alanine ligase [Alkalilimnicola sp. S0819]MPQ15245.1 pantoate--beta-alanine ligase [Alkalilimnicola sp. S0819]